MIFLFEKKRVLFLFLCLILFGEDLYSQEKVNIDDISHFSQNSSTVGRSLDELKNKAQKRQINPRKQERIYDIQPFSAQDELCLSKNDLIKESRESLKQYVSLFKGCPLTKDWMAQTEIILEKIFVTIDKDPVTCRQWLKALKVQLSQMEQFRSNLIIAEQTGFYKNTETDYPILPVAFDKIQEVAPKKISTQPDFKGYHSPDEMSGSKKQEISVSNSVFISSEPKESLTQSKLVKHYELKNRLEIVDSFQYALDRRIYFWSLATNYYEVKNQKKLIPPREFALGDLWKFKKVTNEVRLFFGVDEVGQSWRQMFEVDALYNDLQKLSDMKSSSRIFVPISGKITKDEMKTAQEKVLKNQISFLYDRINSICYKIQTTPMTAEQTKVFQEAPLLEWLRLLVKYSCDPADPEDLLWAFEAYELNSGADRGEDLYRTAYRMKSSRSEVCRKFGEAINIIYDNSNTKVYISEALINRLLPIQDPEFDVVQETVLNNPVAGQRRTDTQVLIKLIPNPDKLLFNLWIHGQMIASTTSNVFPAKMYNESRATYLGRKEMEWKKYGVEHKPTEVMVNNSSKLNDVRTDIDFVPILSDFVRGVAKGQYELMQADIERETKNRILQEVRKRVDKEASERFDELNVRMKERFFGHLEQLGLDLNIQNARTTNEWLLASLRLESERSLGSQTVEPPTLPGAFADLKVHESSVNIFLSRLDLKGKEFNVPELLDHLGTKLKTPAIQKIKENVNEDDLIFVFADSDPVTLRFYENRISLRFMFDAIVLNDHEWNDIGVTVSYCPGIDASGKTTLKRDGIVELDGPVNIRAQIPLRAIFSKVFPDAKPFVLNPAVFEKDSRFAGLSTGLCRVSRGWFALSIIQQPTSVYYYKGQNSQAQANQ